MNSKKRCRICKDYFLVEDFYRPGFCSEKCLKTPARPTKKTDNKAIPTKKKPKHRIPTSVRNAVRERDSDRCRWCNDPRNGSCHHVRYLSEGRGGGYDNLDVESNLLRLCIRCHALAHSSKVTYQPLLQGVLWLEYFHGVHLTVPQYGRWLESVNNP